MEELLKSAESAIICACDHIIELVDREVKRDDRTLAREATPPTLYRPEAGNRL